MPLPVLPTFKPPWSSLRRILAALMKVVRRVSTIRGDEIILVRQNDEGTAIHFNMAAFLAAVPKPIAASRIVKGLSIWVDITQTGTVIVSDDDWRGRVITGGWAVYTGTVSASRLDKWDGAQIVRSGMQGDSNVTPASDATITSTAPLANYVATLNCRNTDGKLYVIVTGSGAGLPFQFRAEIWAGEVGTESTHTV